MTDSIAWAVEVARNCLEAEFPRRWRHVQAVGAKAELLRPVFGDQADALVVSAWLHDVGYSSVAKDTEFHPLDGARYLQNLGVGFDVCCLVCNHSAAAEEAGLRGLADEQRFFPDDRSAVRDALWACDMTTSPIGLPVTFDERLREIKERYGCQHTVPRALTAAADEISAAIERTVASAKDKGIEFPGG
ncbi:phosphohydrolase [Longispora sp. NPDC051575]|uniref:phosphohydrolase n=1 Tax=Longispora sp. NPDC051575 TaxID=3154943 RepID=UPI00341DD279